jgi:hypothetical protein
MRKLLAFVAVVGALLACASAATAASTETVIIKDLTSTQTQPLWCTGGFATVSTDVSGVFHETDLASGGFLITAAAQGTIDVVPLTAGAPTYSGRVSEFFNVITTPADGYVSSSTFHVTAAGSDGSTLNIDITFHITVTPWGDVTAYVSPQPSCH